MGDKSSDQVAPRKMKFTPKIPPPKVTKPAMPKTESSEDAGTDVIDEKLLRLAKQFEQGSGKRLPKVERKVAPVQVAFGHADIKGSIKSFGLPKSGHKHQDGADGSAPKIGKEYIEPWDYYSYYPVVLPLRRPYSGNPELLNEGEFGTASANSTYDEACMKPAEQLGLMDGKETQMLFFQLPEYLPLPKQAAAAQGKEVDSKGGNTTEKGCSVKDLPAGFMGKILVYKSGTVKMKLGDALFEVSPGLETVFSQDVMAINTQDKHCCVLGELNKRAIVTPDVDSLLYSITDLG